MKKGISGFSFAAEGSGSFLRSRKASIRRSIAAVAALAALMAPVVCSATPPVPGPYVSVFAGTSKPEASDAVTNFNGTAYRDRVDFDPGIYTGGTAGFDYGLLRLEGELSYRRSEMKSITDQSNGQQLDNVHGNLGALTFMANAFIDLHNPSPITPYFGAGAGVAVLHLSDTTVGYPRQTLYDHGTETVFAYQVGAGVEIAMNRLLSLDLGYRYLGTNRATFNPGSICATSLKLESHNAMAGLRVKF